MRAMQNEPSAGEHGWDLNWFRPKDKRDRAQCSLYSLTGYPYPLRRGRWTAGETYILNSDLWIAERITEDASDRARPIDERPGIRSLVHLGMAAGGVVVESLDDLGDVHDQAAVGLYFQDLGQDHPLATPAGPLSESRLNRLLTLSGGAARVRPVVDGLKAIRDDAVVEALRSHEAVTFGKFGSLGRRDYEAAVEWTKSLRAMGCARQEIIDRLNLEGYVNPSGRRRWNVHNVPVTT